MHREHEAAIVWLATQLELVADDGVTVLTERECRRREAPDAGKRYSVEVAYSGPRQDRRRWPDLVVESEHGMRAIEIEFAPKGRDRLDRIVLGFTWSDYDEVVFLARSAAIRRTLEQLARHHGGSGVFLEPAEVLAASWSGLDAALIGQLAQAFQEPAVEPPAPPEPTATRPLASPEPVLPAQPPVDALDWLTPPDEAPATKRRWLRRRRSD